MIILKILGKVLLVPVWIVLTVAWILFKALVSIYSVAKGLFSFVLALMFVGMLIWWRGPWMVVAVMGAVEVALSLALMLGVIIEEMLCRAGQWIGWKIVS